MKHFHRLLVALSLIILLHPHLCSAQDQAFESRFSALDQSVWYVSNGWTNGPHQSCEWRSDAFSIQDSKLLMTVSDRGGKVRPIGCPEMHTKAHLKYGLYETRMKTASGIGLNTAFFTYIGKTDGAPAHDEIDFEFLGKDPTKVEINHTAYDRIVVGKIVDLGFDSSKDFHVYGFDWAADGIKWFVDGVKVYETPKNVPIPNIPSYLFLSLWSGAEPEDSWMGHFSYFKPLTAEVDWVRFTPHS